MPDVRTARLHLPPESADDLTAIAERWLRIAGAAGVLPTPLEGLYAAARVKEYSLVGEEHEGLFKRLLERAGDSLHRALQKVRGITDLRQRAVYLSGGDTKQRERFVRAHELAHNLIPWQNFNGTHIDEAYDFTPDARRGFDREANFLGVELLFQGHRFQDHVRSYTASLSAVNGIAQRHGTSLQSTLWKYAEAQDERILFAMYYPDNGTGNMRLWKLVASPTFKQRFPNILLPEFLSDGHPWRAARDLGQDIDDSISLDCGVDGSRRFRWEARWNGYTLLVLVRRMPQLSSVGRLIRSV